MIVEVHHYGFAFRLGRFYDGDEAGKLILGIFVIVTWCFRTGICINVPALGIAAMKANVCDIADKWCV